VKKIVDIKNDMNRYNRTMDRLNGAEKWISRKKANRMASTDPMPPGNELITPPSIDRLMNPIAYIKLKS
jgi:hypothetical protein